MEKITVLIVDDDPSILRIHISHLSSLKENINILTATNGRMACEIAHEQLPDIVLMDWNMPEMTGVDALKILKSQDRTKDIPVVMITSITSSEYLAYAFDLGAQDYIRKPVDKIELLARLKSLVALQESKRMIKLQNENLEQRKKALEESNAAKDRFFSIIGHDLNNPFMSLIGFSELLIEDYDELDDKTKIDYLRKIQNEANTAKKLLENLLEWSKSQTGQIEVKTEKIELYNFVLSQLSMRKSAAGAKNISMYTTIDDEIFVMVDKNMLKTIFRNLISNALLYSKSGDSVAVHAETKSGLIDTVIEDTGIGIDPVKASGLFTIDAQSKGNHGLGLILCKEFVEKNGGQIWVESEIGKGSKFHFTLPRG
jgi:signal transduction histidine kinase